MKEIVFILLILASSPNESSKKLPCSDSKIDEWTSDIITDYGIHLDGRLNYFKAVLYSDSILLQKDLTDIPETDYIIIDLSDSPILLDSNKVCNKF